MVNIHSSNEQALLATDRLDLLRLFVQIAELGKISAAGEALGLSQPSASRLLKRLEKMVNSRLLQRAASGVTLTTNGQEFLISARRVLDEWERAMQAAQSKQQALSGNIKIAVPVAIGQNFLASMVARFLCQYPEIT